MSPVPAAPTLGVVHSRAYTIPTDAPESDGTFAWHSTALVVVEVEAKDGRASVILVRIPAPRSRQWTPRFHDHVRIEHMLFDGAPVPQGWAIRPDLTRPGRGLDVRWQDAEQFAE